MQAQSGYYSLIQYCPDAARLETVNVGLVVINPSVDYLGVRLAENNERIGRVFRGHAFRPWELEAAKRALANRLQSSMYRPHTLEEFQHFIDTRGNELRLTPLRPVNLSAPEVALSKLFRALVQEPLRIRLEWADLLGPQLEALFAELVSVRRAKRQVRVEVPLTGRKITFPYAYHNGAIHLIKPWQFPRAERQATDQAMKLAVEGDLIARHRMSDGNEARVVLIARFEAEGQHKELRNRVLPILSEYPVRTVTPEEVDAFVEQVRREAR
jgi:hypothetical protein